MDYIIWVFASVALAYWIDHRYGWRIERAIRVLLIPVRLFQTLWIKYSNWIDNMLK